jgi:phage-related protein
MNTFIWVPSYGAAVKSKPRVAVTSFGDGYEARSPTGINNKPRQWSNTFANRPTATADSIADFLDTAGASSAFLWTPPYGAAGKWVCREWDDQKTGPYTRTITATFEEVFEV